MLVAAINPRPRGYLNDTKHACRCTPARIQRYRAKISGPLLDRIDIHVAEPAVPWKDLQLLAPAESSAANHVAEAIQYRSVDRRQSPARNVIMLNVSASQAY